MHPLKGLVPLLGLGHRQPWVPPDTTWYSYGIYDGAWDASTQQMQFCNLPDFTGSCMYTPVHDLAPKKPDLGWTVDWCIILPPLKSNFTAAYGDYTTLSARAGTGLECETYFLPNCIIPTNVTITEQGYSNFTAEGIPPFFMSFECHPANQPADNRVHSSTWSPTFSSALVTPTHFVNYSASATFTVVPSALASNDAALQGYFNPIYDDLLMCEDNSTAHCLVVNSSAQCKSLSELSTSYGFSEVSFVNAGYARMCHLYKTSACDGHSFYDLPGMQLSANLDSLPGPWDLASSSFVCWWLSCTPDDSDAPPASSTLSDYSQCVTSSLAEALTATFSPIPAAILTGTGKSISVPTSVYGLTAGPVSNTTATLTITTESVYISHWTRKGEIHEPSDAVRTETPKFTLSFDGQPTATTTLSREVTVSSGWNQWSAYELSTKTSTTVVATTY